MKNVTDPNFAEDFLAQPLKYWLVHIIKQLFKDYCKGSFHLETSASLSLSNTNKHSSSRTQMTHSREAVQGKERGWQLWVLTGLIGRSVMVDHNELWWGYVRSGTQVKITIWAIVVWLGYPQLWSNNDGWCVLTFFCVWKSLLWDFQHFVGGSWLSGGHSDSMTNKKFNSKLHAHKNIF